MSCAAMRLARFNVSNEHGEQHHFSFLGLPRKLRIDMNDLEQLQSINVADAKAELLSQEELFLKLAGDLPKEMIFQRELLISRL